MDINPHEDITDDNWQTLYPKWHRSFYARLISEPDTLEDFEHNISVLSENYEEGYLNVDDADFHEERREHLEFMEKDLGWWESQLNSALEESYQKLKKRNAELEEENAELRARLEAK